ncbi:hypothetical protein [Falsiroseomonas tokyonensis]|uniref:hypothetical protein n=1 Tax=Falsiroseomonas tokyonensis TaxID=430521 RepID=UPI001C2027A6|nr:hypothetical protein [Falsiroseomonas tokyonensis]
MASTEAEAMAMRPNLSLLLLLAGCATPEVLRRPPDAASMEQRESLPIPAIAEPTGEPAITLPDPTPIAPTLPAGLRSDPAAMP